MNGLMFLFHWNKDEAKIPDDLYSTSADLDRILGGLAC